MKKITYLLQGGPEVAAYGEKFGGNYIQIQNFVFFFCRVFFFFLSIAIKRENLILKYNSIVRDRSRHDAYSQYYLHDQPLK